jgi:hypothetical protein
VGYGVYWRQIPVAPGLLPTYMPPQALLHSCGGPFPIPPGGSSSSAPAITLPYTGDKQDGSGSDDDKEEDDAPQYGGGMGSSCSHAPTAGALFSISADAGCGGGVI